MSDFRQRMFSAQAQDLALEPILQLCRERGWLKARGKQSTDATAALARVQALSSLESVGGSMRMALNALAEEEPTWLSEHLNPQWFDRYVDRFELARFPKAETQRQFLREQVGQDVAQLLAAIDGGPTPQSVRLLPEVTLLRQVFAQHYEGDGPVVSHEADSLAPGSRGAQQVHAHI